MQEVAGNALDLVIRSAQAMGRERSEVLAAFGCSERIPARLDWDTYVAGMRWFESCAESEQAIVEAGARHFLEIPTHRSMVAVLRLFTSPRDFYWVMHRWGGHGMFNNARTEYQILGETQLRLTLSVAGQRPPPAFFAITAGAFRAGPNALGYPSSVIRYEIKGNTCDYHIEHASSRSIMGRLRAMALSLGSRRGVLDELDRQKQTLTSQLRELEEAHRQVTHALALRQRFLTTVTHEMRTPLAGVIGMADLMRDPSTDCTEFPALAQQVSASANDLLCLVNDIITLEGEYAEVVAPNPESLAALAEALVSNHRYAARNKGLELTSVVAPGLPPTLMLDRRLVSKAVRYLLDNALAFTAKGEVRLELAQQGANLEVRVIDTGPGIREGMLSHIFEPFFQGDATLTRSKGGLGLGLAVARRVARTIGGEIGVRSELGVGSTFVLRIPMVAVPADHVIAVEPHRPSSDLPGPKAAEQARVEGKPAQEFCGVRALVVEDNLVNQKVLTRILANLGISVEVAENGKQAVEACGPQSYDIIFMDLQMPVMDGFQAAEAILSKPNAKKPPILAVTANSEQEFRARAASVGMTGFIPKPVSRASIEGALKTVSVVPATPTL